MVIGCSPPQVADGGTAGGGMLGPTGTGGGSAGGTSGASGGGTSGGPTAGGGSAGGSSAGGSSAGGSAATGVPYAYVGSGGNIYIFRLEPSDGGLTPRGQIAAGNGSSFLAVHPSKRWLYAVNEGSSQVASFAIDAGTGGLTFINRVSSFGMGPAHLSVHPSGQYVLVSHYGNGAVAVPAVIRLHRGDISIDRRDSVRLIRFATRPADAERDDAQTGGEPERDRMSVHRSVRKHNPTLPTRQRLRIRTGQLCR
jgi:hypothetical protein